MKPLKQIVKQLPPYEGRKKIRVKHFEELEPSEILSYINPQTHKRFRCLARDLYQPNIPGLQSLVRPPYIWNGEKRIIRKIKGKWYLVTII